MKAAACSCRVMTSWIDDLRMDSTTSRFSSPGIPKIRSTPWFSGAATRRSEPLTVCCWRVSIRFVTHDLARCRLAARLVAMFYDWWNIFVRLAEPDRHREAVTSRPLLLHAIAERVRHARATTIKIASTHARAVPAAKALRAVALFLRGLAKNAEQLTNLQRWREILARAFRVFLNSRPLRLPRRLALC